MNSPCPTAAPSAAYPGNAVRLFSRLPPRRFPWTPRVILMVCTRSLPTVFADPPVATLRDTPALPAQAGLIIPVIFRHACVGPGRPIVAWGRRKRESGLPSVHSWAGGALPLAATCFLKRKCTMQTVDRMSYASLQVITAVQCPAWFRTTPCHALRHFCAAAIVPYCQCVL